MASLAMLELLLFCWVDTTETKEKNTSKYKLSNSSIPEFLKRMLQFLNLDLSTDANRGFSLK